MSSRTLKRSEVLAGSKLPRRLVHSTRTAELRVNMCTLHSALPDPSGEFAPALLHANTLASRICRQALHLPSSPSANASPNECSTFALRLRTSVIDNRSRLVAKTHPGTEPSTNSLSKATSGLTEVGRVPR